MGGTKKERKFDGSGLGRSGADLQDNQANRIGGTERSSKVLCQADKSGFNIDLRQVDVLLLPSVNLAERKKLPNLAGVYFVFNNVDECLYVGMTESLVLRWLNHHKLKELQKIEGVRIAWFEVEDKKSLDQTERFFIKDLKPLLNGKGIGKETELRIRISSLEKQKLMELAEERSMSASELIRYLLRREWDKPNEM